MAKRTVTPSPRSTLAAINETFEKLDYRNQNVQALYAQVSVLSTMIDELQEKLLIEMEVSLMNQYHRQLVEVELERQKGKTIEIGVEHVSRMAARELDLPPEQIRRVMSWLAGESMAEVSVSYREELRDLLADLAEWMKNDE
jgi:hypothetical protein